MNSFAKGMIWFATTAFVTPLPALTDFGAVASRVRNQVVKAPLEAPLVTLDLTDRGLLRQEYVLRRTADAQGYRVDAEGTLTVHRVFRSDGRLISLEESDSRSGLAWQQTVNGPRTQVRTRKWENGRLVSDNNAALPTDLVLPSELDTVIAQAWQAGVRDGLKLKSLSPDGSTVGDFHIPFVETRHPLTLSAKYTYPDELRQALPADDYVVADMSLTGIGALFFPHHYYLVFRKQDGELQFVAYFGEKPSAARFQFTPR